MPKQEATLRDVFISHSTADKALVNRIVAKLNEDGLSVWYAPADIKGGEKFIREIEEGLRTSQVVVTLFSPSALDSFWVEAEWSVRLIQMSKDRTRRLIPVVLDDVEDDQIPLLLQLLDRLDFRGADLNDPVTLREKVDELTENIRGELPPPGVEAVGIPVVVFAMTEQEVDEMISGSVFEKPHARALDRQNFEDLGKQLAKHDLDHISEFYGRAREEWRPPIANGATIRDVVEEVVGQVNKDYQSTPGLPIIRPQFFSTDFLSDDEVWRGRIWNQLDKLGYVLIIDAISWFHPLLRLKLERCASPLSPNNRQISIVVLSPIGSSVLPISRLLEDAIRPDMPRVFDRFAVHLDMLCEFGVCDVRALKRWLFSALPETARTVQGHKAYPLSKEKMREEWGQPIGIDQVIFGRGGQ